MEVTFDLLLFEETHDAKEKEGGIIGLSQIIINLTHLEGPYEKNKYVERIVNRLFFVMTKTLKCSHYDILFYSLSNR